MDSTTERTSLTSPRASGRAVPGGFVLGSYLPGTLAARFFRSHILVAARVLTFVGLSAGLLFATLRDLHPVAVFAVCVFVGIGNGLTTPVVNLGVMSDHPSRAGTATGLSAATAIGGGALISSVAGVALGTSGSPRTLLTLLLASASLALVAALWAAAADRGTAPTRPTRNARRTAC
ncbi:hypothetical protein AB0B88_02655 [Micromonospora haikouensis]|uniref:hypothetical protein n=1 Tax=Micromonospora haikouensis TaxID=686309 RepID=UPI00340DCF8D